MTMFSYCICSYGSGLMCSSFIFEEKYRSAQLNKVVENWDGMILTMFINGGFEGELDHVIKFFSEILCDKYTTPQEWQDATLL